MLYVLVLAQGLCYPQDDIILRSCSPPIDLVRTGWINQPIRMTHTSGWLINQPIRMTHTSGWQINQQIRITHTSDWHVKSRSH